MTQAEYDAYLKTVQFTNAAGERYGQLNLPKTLPYADTQVAGQTYYDFSKADSAGNLAQTKPISDLLNSGIYRDIKGTPVSDFTSGKLSLEQVISNIKGTPVFNPATGPQINFGAGNVPYTSLNPAASPTGVPTSYVGGPINADTIKPSTPLPVQFPAQTPTFNVAGLNSLPAQTTALTGPQTDLQKRLNDIMSYNTELAGKSSYQAQQETAQGIPDLTKITNDLSSQLKVSQLEAANIQAETQTGQGVTSAIDQRQRAEKLRLNSVHSLQLFAQLEMAKGNLSTAQDAVTRAVALKYDPIEAQIKAATANADLILRSPEYTAAEQNQAQQVKDAQALKAEQVAKAKADANDIWNDILLPGIENGLSVDAQNKIKALIDSGDPDAKFKAAQIASGTLVDSSVLSNQINSLASSVKPGETSTNVENLQRALISAGFSIPALQNGTASYGYFGSQTQAALDAFRGAKPVVGNQTSPAKTTQTTPQVGTSFTTTDGFRFTTNEIQDASSKSGIPLADLKSLPGQVINVFTSGSFDDIKERIDQDLSNFVDPSEIERDISNELSLPDAVKDALVRYLKSEESKY